MPKNDPQGSAERNPFENQIDVIEQVWRATKPVSNVSGAFAPAVAYVAAGHGA
ncbi:hypothetical protein GGTG_06570 [Gaeumannomyces tritici R3-111a-1]|uniref:Uncharacterized protein n=1 Tax=Gaeumannomyces tritici (strain R3-111a-1) TaxID=644352 RepID=J3NZ70_GAET3|nr:hypothetical protein GGTG_06570 [Gaeumannomyces tritici R3-111a-1]EJT76653.1 hypothetical protein GGTG_06570 [Gaeumannomyces tritici R3-111a-1]